MISKTSLQSIQAFLELADLKEGETKDAATIARTTGFPESYMAKVLQRLARHGFVISQKGLKGGFRLAKSTREITLYDVVNVLEDVTLWQGCFMGQAKCSQSSACSAHQKWDKVRRTYIDFLKQTTIADLS